MNFLKEPNLPEKRVKYVIVSDYQPEFRKELEENYHINTIFDFEIKNIKAAERYHADMCVCHIKERIFFVSSECNILKQELEKLGGTIFDCDDITQKFPKLNLCILKNKVLCNIKRADKVLLEFLKKQNSEILNIHQSYTKCSAAIVSENAVITSDESVYQACRKNQIDVLKIRTGFIQLDGYDYGFIGGTCGLLDKNLLAFSGNIKLHPDYENIKAFCRNYQVDLTSLGNQILYDIGGILPIGYE